MLLGRQLCSCRGNVAEPRDVPTASLACASSRLRLTTCPPCLAALLQLGMAQRMAQLYRESKEERAAKCTELEGVVQELKAHMEVRQRLRGARGGTTVCLSSHNPWCKHQHAAEQVSQPLALSSASTELACGAPGGACT